MNKSSEAFDSARSEYIEGYVEKKEHIFPTLSLIAKEFKQKMDNYYKADKEMRTLQAQRKTAELTIDLWRSINAARRAGG